MGTQAADLDQLSRCNRKKAHGIRARRNEPFVFNDISLPYRVINENVGVPLGTKGQRLSAGARRTVGRSRSRYDEASRRN